MDDVLRCCVMIVCVDQPLRCRVPPAHLPAIFSQVAAKAGVRAVVELGGNQQQERVQ